LRIARAQLDQIVDHARQDAPDECCGLVGVVDGRVASVHPTENTVRSPLRFEMDGMELYRTIDAIEGAGQELGAVYHSHTRTAPYPSQTDVNFSASWPGIEWIIVGLAGGGEVEIRSYRIDDGRVEEVPLEVE
jgi:[CysO sulfur-carrier protein]-S-L-cysteine hydrolase